ncbi:MAG: hypothetical protein JW776_13615 [Candidatus Lokiarchaeota archaeon]|nr:hypothetical protein [Candidatus Lokiarchaeota archaeon]
MSDAAEYYQRGLTFLSEKPPNLIKALSLIRKAKLLFDQKGNERESEAAQDKIYFVYISLIEKEYEQAKNFLTIGSFEKALSKGVDAYSHLDKSSPKYSQKTSKKIENLIEQIAIELLYDIERSQDKISIDESLSKLHYVERVILDVFYSHLKSSSDKVEIPENFIKEIQDKRKIQRAFINIYESLGNHSKDLAKTYIQEGNITQGAISLNLAKQLYETTGSTQRLDDLKPLYQKIHEAQGDLAYTNAEQLMQENRLEKARNQLKKARDFYSISQNDKKKKAAEELYLNVSVELGENLLEDAEKALELNDMKSTIDYLKEAYDFFSKINHKKLKQQTEQKLNRVYSVLGDRESELAEQVDPSDIINKNLSKLDLEEYSFQSEFFLTSELISQKLQRLHGASYYYQKAHNEIQLKKNERKIHSYTEKIANLYLNQGKRDFKNREYEKAQIHLKKSIFYYQNNNQKINSIRGMLQKIEPKINAKKLEKIKKSLIQYNELISEQYIGNPPTSGVNLHGDTTDQQYRCKNCGNWVQAYYYDSIQERCLECRSRIICDECRKEIGPNEIYQQCLGCKAIFCLDCAERVFDFIQKKCLSCRVVQICDICQKEAKPTESFSECPLCHKICCTSHFDFQQGLCNECRQIIKCSQCGVELNKEDVFVCDVCKNVFCAKHFDVGRNTCIQDRKEEICAKCGKILKKEDSANKCPKCGFMYCTNHFSEFHEMCTVCLPKLECSFCGMDLSKENFFQCNDCKKVFCRDHFNSALGRCLSCTEKVSTVKINAIGVQTITQDATQMYDLQASTMQPIIAKFNRGEVLESEEIDFLLRHQINLPIDEEKYVNIGSTQNVMVLIRQPDNKPYVVLVPETPIVIDVKYYGDLFRKLIPYLPEVPLTIDGMTSIVNLIFYASNNPRWALMYEILHQTLLKTGIEVLHVLVLVFRKANTELISQSISDSILEKNFSGTNIKEALKFIQTNDSEDEVGLFSNNERLDQLLKVFYNLHRGNVLRAAELLAIYEIDPK